MSLKIILVSSSFWILANDFLKSALLSLMHQGKAHRPLAGLRWSYSHARQGFDLFSPVTRGLASTRAPHLVECYTLIDFEILNTFKQGTSCVHFALYNFYSWSCSHGWPLADYCPQHQGQINQTSYYVVS
jgi:hypothetical protein